MPVGLDFKSKDIIMAVDKILLEKTKAILNKEGYVPPPGGGGMPHGGMPPMDPSIMGGGMPPMDPSMMRGGMPPGGMPPGGIPMDPSMMGGMPPMDPSMMPPGDTNSPPEGHPEQMQKDIENIDSRLKNLEDKNKLMLEKLDMLISEAPAVEKVGSEERAKSTLWAIRQLLVTDSDE